MNSATLLRKGMKRQSSIFQSAAALVLACSSSHGAFVPNPHFSNPRLALSLEKPALSNKSIHLIHNVNYSSTLNMSLIKDKEDEALVNHLLLPYEDGSHGAAKIILPGDADSSEYETLSIASFKHRLESTITACKELDKKSLWLEVPISKARYIEACSDIEGLEFHHASGNTAYLSMWLRDDIECKIPEFATHQIGVGAIVVNSRDEILCVRELRRNFRPWKIPGGLADLGEQLNDAAIREVMEETGIQCKFQNILGFRHAHGMQFGRSDMYFVCRLEPEEGVDGDGNAVIPNPVAQEGEIAAVAWVPLQEYKEMINGENPHPMMQTMMSLHALESGKNDIQRTVVNSIVPGRKPSPVYHAPGV